MDGEGRDKEKEKGKGMRKGSRKVGSVVASGPGERRRRVCAGVHGFLASFKVTL